MARPRPDFPPIAAIRGLADGHGRLAVKVTPGARSEAMEVGKAALLVKVRARPQDGAANEAVVNLLARALNIAPSEVEMLRGATSRSKLIRIRFGESGD